MILVVDSCQFTTTWMYNIRLQAPTPARRCKISHWLPRGADGWVGGGKDGCMVTKISRMNRQPNLLRYGAPYSTVKIFKFVYMHKNNSDVFP